MKYTRCNNVGEKEDFERPLTMEGMVVQLKYTIPDTPQQNRRVERKSVCTKLNGRKFSIFLINSLWAEAANTATLTQSRDLSPC